jgi:hypothetical protein
MKLLLSNLEDSLVTENFRIVQETINAQPILRGSWKHFEIAFSAAVDNLRFSHGLGFLPKDIITTMVSNQEAVIWNYSLFTSQFLDITVSGACTVRCFIGRYGESHDL